MKQESIKARQTDTRQKIMMGGLIVKAGLAELHKSNPEVILGILLEAQAKLKNGDNISFEKWRKEGIKVMLSPKDQ